jgi:Asp-tRNA(Asn)/Glu-tRNA(Gln) amidotransferase B subunit
MMHASQIVWLIALRNEQQAHAGHSSILQMHYCRSADEAAAFVRKLQQILQEIGTCSGQMAEV